MKSGQRPKVKGQSGLTLLLIALLGCIDQHPLQLEPPIVRADGIVAYLVATPAAEPNEYIVRAVSRHGVALEDPGSFVAALQWASPAMSFVSDVSDAKAVRFLTAGSTTVRVAGASAEGLANGELFAVRVRAPGSGHINTLRLEITDLNDRSGVSMRPKLVVVPTVAWTATR